MKLLLGLLCLASVASNAFGQALLAEMVPYPFHVKHSESQNNVTPITDGRAALQLRLEMIRRAKKSISVEYFIYNTDLAGKLITKELIKAAQRGVKVQILIDKSIAVFQFDEFYAKALKDYGIDVRYYNDAPFVRVSSVQFRNHRKLLAVDDVEGITGGRNIGNDYFDLSEEFNFNDTDVYVQGPIVKTMRESFDAYFEHKISERPKFPALDKPLDLLTAEKFKKKEEAVKTFLADSEEEEKALESLETSGKKSLGAFKSYVCPEMTYVTDGPGASFISRMNPNFDEEYKFVRKVLFDKLSRVDKSVLISSPYLIANSHSNKLMKNLLKKNVEISIYTNSLASTDAVYVAANLYFDVFRWAGKGIHIYLHDGLYVDHGSDLDEKIKQAKWGTHTKAQVYESSHSTEAMIGTYNIDNRSNFYNSEMAVFCKGNDEYTKAVKSGILEMASHGIKINPDATATDRNGNKKSIFGSSAKDVKIMSLIFLPSWMLKFLL